MSTTILQPELAAKQKERSLSSVKAFRNDERGVVAMIFGLLFIPLLMAIGLAVDVARWVQSKNESQSVVDAMALAAGRAAQMATNGAEALAGSNPRLRSMNGKIEPTIEPHNTTPTRLRATVKATRK